jgi:glycosyltransferase involved in cell wall biosynthesis
MMRALRRRGTRVGLATLRQPAPEALSNLDLDMLVSLANLSTMSHQDNLSLSRLQKRYCSYWGVEPRCVNELGRLAEQFGADAVIACGLDALPMLSGIRKAQRVWFADEWVLHHASLVRLADPRSWANVRAAIVKGVYERAFRQEIDRAWVVSTPDARAMRWIAGVRHVDVIRYSVDSDWFHPIDAREDADSAIFWGTLDFAPNVQALDWFVRHVWPVIRHHRPQARFTIAGFNPKPEVHALARMPGVTLHPNLPDIRTEVAGHAVVVLPFISGAGIKTKLLEAAAMGKAVVCSPRALLGIGGDPPLIVAHTCADWLSALSMLWFDRQRRREIGRHLRSWVVAEHGLERGAQIALELLAGGSPSSRPHTALSTSDDRAE